MSGEEGASESNVIEPTRALPSKYVEPIMYLADRMASADKKTVSKERSIIDVLAEAVNRTGFRTERTFMELDEDKACSILDVVPAKRCALVVMALVLKSDHQRVDAEHQYFHKIREKLGTDPVVVPLDLEAHKQLALKYLTG